MTNELLEKFEPKKNSNRQEPLLNEYISNLDELRFLVKDVLTYY